jgi:hypothetical protein
MSLATNMRELNDAELDAVTGGIAVVANDVIDINNNDVQVAVPVAAAVAVLGGAAAGNITRQTIEAAPARPGRT